MPHFELLSFTGLRPGPCLIVLGAVHGNEIAGTLAIRRLIDELHAGRLLLDAGRLTLVPVANPLAYAQGQRNGQRNLNRALGPTAHPAEFEDHVVNWLCPLLAAHDVLLDLHSFNAPGRAFAMVGPLDNDGPVQPFRHSAAEQAMALRLGVDRLVDGWLGTYAQGVARRQARQAGAAAAHDVRHGVGTTEYMRSVGGYGVTLECGQHADPAAPEVGYRAILNTLAHLGLCGQLPVPAPRAPSEALSLYEVVDRVHDGDRFSREWRSFDRVGAGELIGTRHDGTQVRSDCDGWIVFPDAKAAAGDEWFYLAKPTSRFAA
jgi:predicted deacylase